jgi:hypothetical protein
MTMPAQRKAPNANTALRRRNGVRLLQEGGKPAQVDVSHHDVRGIALLNGNLRGANLSQARDSEQLKHRLWRRGALFREAPKVRVAGRFSEGAGRRASGFALGFLSMSVAGFLCIVGLRLRFSRWLK